MIKRETSIEKLKHNDVVCFISCYDGRFIAESLSLIKDNKNKYAAFVPYHLPMSDNLIYVADSLEELLLRIAASRPNAKLMCADMKASYNDIVPAEAFTRVLWRNLMVDDRVTLYEVIA